MKAGWPLGLLLVASAFALGGCIVSTVVGTAVDLTVEAVKVPFKVGGAVVDAVSDDDDEAEDGDKADAQEPPAGSP